MNKETKDKIVDKVIALFNDYDISEIKEAVHYNYYINILFEGMQHTIFISKEGNASMTPIFNISGDERIVELYKNVGEQKKIYRESKEERMFNKFLETEIENLKL
jgi:hypothetical protein